MEPIFTPQITISFAVDIDLNYDPFLGKTSTELALALQEEMDELLMELSPSITNVYSSITAINSND